MVRFNTERAFNISIQYALPEDRIPVRLPISRKVAEDARRADVLALGLYIKIILLTFVLINLVSRDNETGAENAMITTYTLVEDIKGNHIVVVTIVEEGKMRKDARPLPSIVRGILFFTKDKQVVALHDLVRPSFVFPY